MSQAGTDCPRCDGCGQIANSAQGEPWTQWLALPASSRLAITLGLVKPLECPDCQGTGKHEERER